MEPTVQVLAAQHLLLVCAIVLGAGAVLAYVANRIGIPDIVLFLLAGLGLGPAGAGLIDVGAGSTANQLILLFGASYILFDGGAVMRVVVLKRVWMTVAALATLGVAMTTAVIGVAVHYVFGLPLYAALLTGSVIASTDPATLVPVFRQVKVRERLKQAVIAESAFNDAIAAILTFTLLTLAGGGEVSVLQAAGEFLWQALGGVAVGAVAGYAACFAIAHERLSFLRENLPLVTLVVVAGAVLTADHHHASGFMAVFVAGLCLGNKQLLGFAINPEEERQMEDFIGTTGLIMRMFIFMLLGAQTDISLLARYALPAVAVVTTLMFVARPLVIAVCAVPDRRAQWSISELVFLCWTRETGVIPAALAGMLVGVHAPYADVIAAVTFMAVLLTIPIQAASTPWLARRLGVLEN
ncbi:MAG: sodium:proton antiporter [Rhodospirillaceae bacterium]|nr:MAG: sodium:proton antiporter [Rhodospirillaceae bacterium]